MVLLKKDFNDLMTFGLEVGFIGLSKTCFKPHLSKNIFRIYELESIYNDRSFVGFGISVLTTSGQSNSHYFFILICSLYLTIFLTKWIPTCNNALRWSCLGLFTVAAKQIDYTVLYDLKITYRTTTIIKNNTKRDILNSLIQLYLNFD